MRNLSAIAVLFVLSASCPAGEVDKSIAERDQATLRQFQIVATAPGIRRFLEPPPLTIGQQVSIGTWIEDLGSPRFNTRRLATRDLIKAGPAVLPYLGKVANHTDPEIRLRANYIIKAFRQRGVDRKTAVIAALRTIEREKFRSLTPLLLQLLRDMEEGVELQTTTRVLSAIVQPSDTPLLVQKLHDRTSPRVRTIAANLLEKAAGAEALAELRKLTSHPDENLRLVALEEIAKHAPRECLPALVKLLESADVQIRSRAALLLRTITGQRYKFIPYGKNDARLAAVKRWNGWLAEEAPTAILRQLGSQAMLPRGRILLCLFQPFRVAEFNEAGKEVFSTRVLRTPCGAAGLPDGRRIFADWEGRAVVTLSETGVELCSYPVPGIPNSLNLLPNGNILVGLYDKKLIYEMNAAGKFVWQASVKAGPSSASRLPNGATLVAMQETNRVVEIDRTGKETWSMQCDAPNNVRRLKNGNTLVASAGGRVYEYDRKGEVVWRSKAFNWPYDAVELENGNIMIGSRDGLIECDREHNVIRKLTAAWVRRIAIY